MNAETRSALRALPKSDLHLHLEGTVSPETLHALARKNSVSLQSPVLLAGGREIAAPDKKFLEAPFRSGTFRDFIRLYVKISECLQSAEDLVQVAKAYGESAKQDGVRSAEIYVTPTTLTTLNLAKEELFQGLKESQKVLQNDFQLRVRWIFDIVRNSPLPGNVTLNFALQARAEGVDVASIGIAGLEAGYPALPFREVLQEAKSEGFQILIHAGETESSASIWDALKAGPPARIGHGISVLEDPDLVRELQERNIPLEICLASNLAISSHSPNETRTGHPLKDILDQGVPVVLASDDPGIFGKGLMDNFELASELGVSDEQLLRLAAEAKAYSPFG